MYQTFCECVYMNFGFIFVRYRKRISYHKMTRNYCSYQIERKLSLNNFIFYFIFFHKTRTPS
ncbi:hypothetical protein HanIR_Chr03g0100631 [Helianthus annuus]|nr:hypothetical protein HanIR_Chr03g0100631 [Helianthus annuus]